MFGNDSLLVKGLNGDLKKAREENDSMRMAAGFGEEAASIYRAYLGPVLGEDVSTKSNAQILRGIEDTFRERRYLERKLDLVVTFLANEALSIEDRVRYAQDSLKSAQAQLDGRGMEFLPYEWELA